MKVIDNDKKVFKLFIRFLHKMRLVDRYLNARMAAIKRGQNDVDNFTKKWLKNHPQISKQNQLMLSIKFISQEDGYESLLGNAFNWEDEECIWADNNSDTRVIVWSLLNDEWEDILSENKIVNPRREE